LFLKYGRDDERQADDLGLRYMTREGYDPRQLPRVFETLDRVSQAQGGGGRIPEWLSTHPNPGSRSTRLQEDVAAAAAQIPSPRVARNDYLGQLDGVVFGEDPRQGYFDGNAFYHPELAFRIDFPDGWQTANQRQQVIGVSRNQDAAVVLALADGQSASVAARSFFGQQGLQATNTQRGRVGGLDAVSGNFLVQRQGGQAIAGQAVFVEHGGRVFRLLGYTSQNRWRNHGSALQSSVASFRRVTDRRRLDVEPARLDLVRLPGTMTLREFQGRYNSSANLQTLALINQAGAETRFDGGTTLKRVVGGR
ncbi:MAG TPA: M48 family metalloprotease, partial [Thermoanaerobaculia bacterium]|nr:M48 family metalloprotease [Thermoanaerobaculia bacterium]